MKFGKILPAALLGATLLSPLPALAQSAPADAPAAPAAVAPAAPDASAVPAPATPALAADAPPATTTIDNPYGLSALWSNGDFIAKGTLLILAIFSASTWYILITKLIEQGQLFRQAKLSRSFWTAGSVSDGVNTLPAKGAFRAVAVTGVNALEHHEGSLVENIDLNTWITLSIQRTVEQIVSRLQGGLAVLATVGSTAPFIGLFGTVWGIYHALTAIGIAGQASIDKVAGPVGEALIMTALGLATAVPAVLGYNWLVRRNKVAIESVRGFASDLHSLLVSGKVAGARNVPAKSEQASRPLSVVQTA
ncbi:MAG: MotA/TolQ/ExbB proton channel family protein [Acidocella sp.]|nr:MotA/TolQ/ExbB proton channel family protein [Acidocella sp.]